jgi:hypothetical protein
MKDGQCKVLHNGKEALKATNQGGVFRVIAAAAKTSSLSYVKNDIIDFHRRCGHTNYKMIMTVSRIGILPRLQPSSGLPEEACETCLKGKMTRTIIPKKGRGLTTKPGDLIHSDVCGSMRTRSHKEICTCSHTWTMRVDGLTRRS